MPEEQEESPFGEVVYAYTRTQALADGLLVDVTREAKEAGIVYPTAVTQALWNGYIVPPDSIKCTQDVQGRLWDVLTMFTSAARAMKRAGEDVVESQKDTAQALFFKTIFQMPSKASRPKKVTVELKAICGPGDDGTPVITIMLPDED
jgi:hypothetical protein